LESELDVEPGTGGVSAQLLATGMLVVQHPEAEDPFPSRTTLLAQDLVSVGDELRPDVRIRLQDILNFALAYAYARLSLRWRHISAVAADVRKSRERISTSFDHTATSYYVAVFRRLRPYFFTADGQCLFHALCLVLFLRRHGIVPTWVIGVKTGQWQAHSWVQEGPYLLDTNPEKVCEFTPILGI
jgi:hypothetical protein